MDKKLKKINVEKKLDPKEEQTEQSKIVKPEVKGVPVVMTQEIGSIIGRVCDAALKTNGLASIQDVAALLNWGNIRLDPSKK